MKAILLATTVIAFMDICETVVISGVRYNKSDVDANPEAYGRVNKSASAEDNANVPDMVGVDTNVHPDAILPVAPSAPAFVNGGNPVAPTVPSPNQYSLLPEGTGRSKRFFVVRNDGSKVEDVDGIDKAGYPAEQAAWNAIIALPH